LLRCYFPLTCYRNTLQTANCKLPFPLPIPYSSISFLCFWFFACLPVGRFVVFCSLCITVHLATVGVITNSIRTLLKACPCLSGFVGENTNDGVNTLQTANCKLPFPIPLLPHSLIAYSLLPIAYCLLPIAYCLFTY
jgi:hypothetical protein